MLSFQKRREKNKTEQAVKKTRQAWFGRMAALFQRSRLDDGLWGELEELLVSADVGVVTSQRLIHRLKERTRDERVGLPEEALELLKQEMADVLSLPDAVSKMEVQEPPLVLLMVGVNGVGKTTSIAKLANWYKEGGKQVVLGAADTFRPAGIEQLQVWGRRLEIDVIAHQPGADAAAVAFDTLQAALARHAEVVIIDTAGRLHTKFNLMEELEKIQRVLSRQGGGGSQRVLLTLDATTGQNGLVQARSFAQAVKCDGVFLAKLDGTAKGGVVLAIAEELKLPVLYIGTGEQPGDVAPFDPHDFVEGLFTHLGE